MAFGTRVHKNLCARPSFPVSLFSAPSATTNEAEKRDPANEVVCTLVKKHVPAGGIKELYTSKNLEICAGVIGVGLE